jgi:competence ComEA-like helix-hairpin-helix protein
MWRRIRHAIREFSYFSPSLKRGTWVLVGIIILLQIALWSVRYYNLHYRSDAETLVLLAADSIVAAGSPTKAADNQYDTDSLRVDPNTASFEEIVKMGFPAYIARRIVRYREKGGKFYSINDICKIYGIDTAWVYHWKDNWIFPQSFHVNKELAVADRIEINTADTMVFEKLTGIGKALAKRIIKYRELLGGYYSVQQLREVYGLSAEVYQRISSMVWADSSRIRTLPISTASFRELARHPYIGYDLAKKIDKYRKSEIKVSLHRLLQDSVITREQADRLRRYCIFPAP